MDDLRTDRRELPRVSAVPIPCGFDDHFETAELRIPFKYLSRLRRTADKSVRITGPAGGVGRFDLLPGDLCGRIDYRSYGKPVPVTQVERFARFPVLQVSEAKNVGFCEVGDMNVVPDAS